MSAEQSAAEARRRARATWPLKRFRLGEEPSENLSHSTTAEERLAMMWPLALEAWSSAGRALPSYARAEMPGRVIRARPARSESGSGSPLTRH